MVQAPRAIPTSWVSGVVDREFRLDVSILKKNAISSCLLEFCRYYCGMLIGLDILDYMENRSFARAKAPFQDSSRFRSKKQ